MKREVIDAYVKKNSGCECGSKMYPYTDQKHIVLLCYNCGRFSGESSGDALFRKAIEDDPHIILDMLDDGTLKPWKPSEPRKPSEGKKWTKVKFDDL